MQRESQLVLNTFYLLFVRSFCNESVTIKTHNCFLYKNFGLNIWKSTSDRIYSCLDPLRRLILIVEHTHTHSKSSSFTLLASLCHIWLYAWLQLKTNFYLHYLFSLQHLLRLPFSNIMNIVQVEENVLL